MSIARKSMVGFVGQIYTLALGLLSTILIARLLGPAGKGVLAVVAAITSLALGFFSFGLGPALGYFAGKRRFDDSVLVTGAAVWSVVLGFAVAIAVWLTRDLLMATVLKGLSDADLVFVLAFLPAYYFTAFMGAVFVGHDRSEAWAVLQAVSATLNITAVVGASIISRGEAHAMVVALSVAALVQALVTLVVFRRPLITDLGKIIELTRAAWSYAGRSYIGQATMMFFLRADVFFLNYFAGPTAVGVYSVATNLAEKLWLLSSPVANAVYAKIVGNERSDSLRLTALTARAMLVFNTVAGVALMVLAVFFVPVIYGAQFADATWYLLLLLPGVVIYAACQPFGQFYAGQLGRPGTTSALSAVMMVISAVAYVTLIPVWGAAGAAFGSSLSYSSALLGYLILMPRATHITIREMVIPTREDFSLCASVIRTAIARVRRPPGLR